MICESCSSGKTLVSAAGTGTIEWHAPPSMVWRTSLSQRMFLGGSGSRSWMM
jgi:hypothetical protein